MEVVCPGDERGGIGARRHDGRTGLRVGSGVPGHIVSVRCVRPGERDLSCRHGVGGRAEAVVGDGDRRAVAASAATAATARAVRVATAGRRRGRAQNNRQTHPTHTRLLFAGARMGTPYLPPRGDKGAPAGCGGGPTYGCLVTVSAARAPTRRPRGAVR